MNRLALPLLLLAACDAHAQAVCGPREAVLKALAKEYQESPIGMGLDSNGQVVELLTSSSGTWTLMVTRPKGPTCLIGTGEAWQPLEPTPVAEFTEKAL